MPDTSVSEAGNQHAKFQNVKEDDSPGLAVTSGLAVVEHGTDERRDTTCAAARSIVPSWDRVRS